MDSDYTEKVNRNYANSIFVGNLTYDCTPDDLRDHFSQVGDVVRADIITSRGHHRGMGTVEFTNTRDVDEAIRQYDGSEFMDRPIFVRQDNPPPESSRERNVSKKQNGWDRNQKKPHHEVLVQNLPFSVNWQALKDMFKECGQVTHADIELDNDGYSTGQGRVVYSNPEDAMRAIQKYNGYELEGKIVEVREGKQNLRGRQVSTNNETTTFSSGSNNNEKTNISLSARPDFTEGYVGGGDRSTFIYCSNLPYSTARSDLFDLFESIGKVNNAELRYDSKHAPTGVAVIEYDSIEDADVCIDRLNNYNYGGCDLDISYAKK